MSHTHTPKKAKVANATRSGNDNQNHSPTQESNTTREQEVPSKGLSDMPLEISDMVCSLRTHRFGTAVE